MGERLWKEINEDAEWGIRGGGGMNIKRIFLTFWLFCQSHGIIFSNSLVFLLLSLSLFLDYSVSQISRLASANLIGVWIYIFLEWVTVKDILFLLRTKPEK